MSRGARWPLILSGLACASLALADEPPTTEGRVERIVHNPPADAPILGPRYAPVTIEFFADLSDYTSTFRASEIFRELAQRHPLRLRIVYRLVKRARGEYAEAALEAFAQGRFHAYLKAFYDRNQKTPPQSEIELIAEASGVDFREIERAWLDTRHADAITANQWRQRRFGLLRTPSYLLNGVAYSAIPRDIDALEVDYDAAYADASLLLADGVPLAKLYERQLAMRAALVAVPKLGVEQVDGPSLGAAIESGDNGFDVRGPIDYAGPYSIGPADAPAQLVLYCAIGTRNCNAVASELANIRAAYGDEVRILYKPVEIGLEPEQRDSAVALRLAADCAGEQGLFWEFLARFQMRKRLPGAARLGPVIDDASQRAGLDADRFTTCREASKSALTPSGATREALDVGVVRVPSIVVGGQLYVGSLGFASLSALVDLELAPGMLESWLDE